MFSFTLTHWDTLRILPTIGITFRSTRSLFGSSPPFDESAAFATGRLDMLRTVLKRHGLTPDVD